MICIQNKKRDRPCDFVDPVSGVPFAGGRRAGTGGGRDQRLNGWQRCEFQHSGRFAKGCSRTFFTQVERNLWKGIYQREWHCGADRDGAAGCRPAGRLCGQSGRAAGRERGSVHRRRKDFGNENCSGRVCPACGETDCAFVQVEDGSWRTDGEQRGCVHYAYGKDTREAMDVYNIYTCSKCGASPKCKPGLHTGGSAMVHVGNVISFPQNTG